MSTATLLTFALFPLFFLVTCASSAHRHKVFDSVVTSPSARPAPSGYITVHDPSGAVWDDVSQHWYLFGTGRDGHILTSHVSNDGYAWSEGQEVFTQVPSWVPTYVPLNTGIFWAPDISQQNRLWHLYYAVSSWAGNVSCIGVTTSPTLGPASWTDAGLPVLCSTHSTKIINAIDPHLFTDPSTGEHYLSYGSFLQGLYIVQLFGYPVIRTPADEPINVQRHTGPGDNGAEASWVQVGPTGQFFLFSNWGTCCQGIHSTYNIRVGVSQSPLGPYIDRDGVNLLNNGGTLLLNVSGRQIGPGHMGFPTPGPAGSPGGNMSAPVCSFHYYDRDSNPAGNPTLGQGVLLWGEDGKGWPYVADRL